MSQGLAYNPATGQLLPDSHGRLILTESGGNCCCEPPGTHPTPVCGSDASCNHFCDETKKQYSNAECCDCHCSGRRGFPPAYMGTWSSGRFRTDRHIYSTAGADTFYVTFTETVCPTLTTCDPDVSTDIDVFVEKWTSGVLVDSGTGTVGVDFHLHDVTRGCTDEVSYMIVGVDVTGFTANSGPAWFTGQVALNPSLDGTTNVDADPCEDGEGLPNITPGSNNAFDGGTIGTIAWETTCVDCDDVPYPTGTDPSTTCGSLTVTGFLLISPGVYAAFTATVNKADCGSYIGSGTHGVIVNISSSDDGTTCTCDNPCSSDHNSTLCWHYVITAGGGGMRIIFDGNDICPPTSPSQTSVTKSVDGVNDDFTSVSFTYSDDC